MEWLDAGSRTRPCTFSIQQVFRGAMFQTLKEISQRPEPFEFYTVQTLWDDPHISKQMLKYHLTPHVDIASRKHEFIQKSIAWMVEHFSIDANTRICDLGCGPGLYTQGLSAFSNHVTGVDFSRNSLNYARNEAVKTGRKIDYVQSNYLEYSPNEKFDLILMIMCDFCVLSPVQRVELLTKITTLLAPGGCFLFDGYLTGAFQNYQESFSYEYRFMDGFWAEGEYYGFVNRFKFPAELVTLEKYTIIQPETQWTVYNWLQYYTAEAIHSLVSDQGLRVAEMYGDVSGGVFHPDGDEFALVIQKK